MIVCIIEEMVRSLKRSSVPVPVTRTLPNGNLLFGMSARMLSLWSLQMSCFVVTAWEAFAKQKEKSIWDCPVEFTDVHVFQPVSVKRGDKVLIQVAWDYSGNFQVPPLLQTQSLYC